MSNLETLLGEERGFLNEGYGKVPPAPKGGYVVDMYYEVWDEDAIEAGETDDKGTEVKKARHKDLEDVCDDYDNHDWLEWSSSHLDDRGGYQPWITSDSEQDFRTGERTRYDLFIRRVDKKPLTYPEVKYISDRFRLRGWRWTGKK